MKINTKEDKTTSEITENKWSKKNCNNSKVRDSDKKWQEKNVGMKNGPS